MTKKKDYTESFFDLIRGRSIGVCYDLGIGLGGFPGTGGVKPSETPPPATIDSKIEGYHVKRPEVKVHR